MREEAFRAAVSGAKAASAMTSRFEEFELYRRAIANIPDGLTASELGDLYMAYCSAAFSVDDIPSVEETAGLARRYFLEAGRPVDAASALVALAAAARKDLRPRSQSVAMLDQAEAELLGQAPSSDRSAALADLRYMQAVIALDSVLVSEARVLVDECLALSLESAAPSDDGADALGMLARSGPGIAALDGTRYDVEHFRAWADAIGGNVTGGLATMIDVSRQARDAHFESSGVTGYRVAADVAVRLMEYETAALGVAEGIRYADEIQQSYCRHVLTGTSSHLAWAEGRWDDAIQIAEMELVERGSRRATLGSRAVLGVLAAGRGDIARARHVLDEALAIARPSGDIGLVLPSLWGLAETALIAGEPGRAFDHCQEAVELATPTGERALLVPFVVTGTRAALAARKPEAAERWLDRIRKMLAAWESLAKPALDHADGLVRLAAGSTVTARSAFEAAIAGWDARGRIWEATWARLDLATCLLRSNRYAESLVALEQVREVARRLGSAPILERVEEVSRLARARGGELEPWHPLTAREFEVAKLIAQGMTNAEIAEEIFVSPKTVSAHVEHILAKLGVARRAEIAAWTATISPAEPRSEAVPEAVAAT
jgi:DNA-binding CsgD family transcriptional regulator